MTRWYKEAKAKQLVINRYEDSEPDDDLEDDDDDEEDELEEEGGEEELEGM
jgi:hypothetical protein